MAPTWPRTIIYIIANTIAIGIGTASSVADSKGIAFANTWVFIVADSIAIANAYGINYAVAFLSFVADSVFIRIGCAITVANAQCVQLAYTRIIAIADLVIVRIYIGGTATAKTRFNFIGIVWTPIFHIACSVIVGIYKYQTFY